jgi:hypothetical protein
MIGRGLISDPFTQYDQRQQNIQNKMELFSEFHDTLYAGYSESLSGLYLIKNAPFMGILFSIFSNPHKVAKT